MGCKVQLKNTAVVSPSPKASITAPTDICVGGSATFTGTSTVASAIYLWHFSDNSTDSVLNPAAKTYTKAVTDNVYFVTSVGSCHDTAFHTLHVHGNPMAAVSPVAPRICLGDSVQVTAHNGQTYQWINAVSISNPTISNPYVYPADDTKYTVLVTDSYGCTNTDTLTVTVTKPQQISVTSPLNACEGTKANLAASGTDKYNWINGDDLNSTTSATPATTDSAQNKTYTVVGSDVFGCFTDTANIEVIVRAKPEVDATNNVTVAAGTSAQLSANASNNITSWSWTPTAYLSCTGCSSPFSRPRQSTKYTVEATDNYGCKGSDTVLVTVVCKESLVGIPEVFSPNGDGKNDYFGMAGFGIKTITHFVIYNRNGNKIFERNNVSPLDKAAMWDGMYNNSYMPTGTYVYIIQAVCDAGEVYNLKGTITLIR